MVVTEHDVRLAGFLIILELFLSCLNHKDGVTLGVQDGEELFRFLLRFLELEESQELPVLQDVEHPDYDDYIDGNGGCVADKCLVIKVTIFEYEVTESESKSGNIAEKEKSDRG